MAAIYSTRFGVWKNEAGSVSVQNLTQNVWIVRTVTMYFGGLGLQQATLQDLNTGAVWYAANNGGVPGPWNYWWDERIVVLPGETEGFKWVTEYSAGIDVQVSGYSLVP